MRHAIFGPTRWRRALGGVASLGLVAVASGGCVAAGMAAVGPVMSAVEALADRTVERTLPSDLPGASAAALDTVSRLGFEIRDVQRADEAWTFQAANEKVTVHGHFTPLSPSLTRLSLRVEIGSLAADKSTADEILNHISTSLVEQSRRRPGAASASDSSNRLTEIEAELQRLRTELEAARARAEPKPQRNDVEVRQGDGTRRVPGIISIPASYGIPTIPAPSADAPGADRGPAPVEPVNGLRPVQPIRTTEAGGK